jgi:DNA-directed RNA polymerase specialized sigma24 family protein
VCDQEFASLIQENQKVLKIAVTRAAKTSLCSGVPMRELWDHALVGLFEAKLRYEAEKGPFENYAARVVFGEVLNRVRDDLGVRPKGRANPIVAHTVYTDHLDVADYAAREQQTRETLWMEERADAAYKLMGGLTTLRRLALVKWMEGRGSTKQAKEGGASRQAIDGRLKDAFRYLRTRMGD